MPICRIRKLLALSLFAVAIAWFPPASAHHSHGNYQMTEYTHLTGTVMEMHWMNPHTWIYLEVMGEDGEAVIWAVEAASPNTLVRRGLARDTIKPGDEITVRCHQMRDSSTGCLLGFLTPPGGEEKEWD